MGTADAVHVSFPDQVVERELVVREGAVPAGLRGRFARNGPGLLEIGGEPLHLLDGHGLVAVASFGEGRGRLQARHVETPWIDAERKAGRMLYRRLFTNLPGRLANVFKLSRAGNAGHDVVAHGGRLLVGDDHHFELDPATLATVRPVRFTDETAKAAQSPMPRPDPATGRLVAYVQKEGGLRPDELSFLELDADLRVVSRSAPHKLPASPTVVHDLAFTPHWYVVTEAAARISPLAALAGRRTLFQSFGWPDGTTAAVTLVARPDGARSVRVPLPPSSKAAFHLANAFEQDGRVVVDLHVYDGVVDFDPLGPPELRRRWGTAPRRGAFPTARRLVIDVEHGTIVSSRDLAPVPVELPEVDPRRFGRPYRVLFGVTPGAPSGTEPDPSAVPYFHGLARVDVETGATEVWDAGPTRYVSPPAFAPSGEAEGEGWLLAWVLDAARGVSEVVVLDAARLGDGPVAVLDAGVAIPPSNHTTWLTPDA